MNPTLQNAAAATGRVLLGLLFAVSGFGKITGFAGTAGYMASKGMPMAEVLLVGAIAVELVGGLMLIAGFKARWAALAIAAFLVPTTLIFHNPLGPEGAAQMTQFLKNLSILGGMLVVAAFGPGAWSVDRRRESP
ncbi:MAG: DoxX family protein [Betaproteobacteria bacterium]|nr:DoxX family protein [Betaproteobacteria bacterium]